MIKENLWVAVIRGGGFVGGVEAAGLYRLVTSAALPPANQVRN